MTGWLFIIWASMVWASMASVEAQAAEFDSSSSVVLRIATMGAGVAPDGASLVGPVELGWLERAINERAWPMPTIREWPADEDGVPVVETRRVEEKRHIVKRGETLRRLRTMYRRTAAQLERLNPEIDLQNLEEGAEVVVWRREDNPVSESRGQPQSGRLIRGEPMPDSEHYEVLFPYRAFGTFYAVSELVRSLDAYYATFPQADPLMVGDLSFRTGRRIHPHNSHQAGRDADITLPRLDPPPDYRRFHHVRRDNLDADKALWLLITVLAGGYVQYIFLDWHHQRTLYNLATEQGAPEEWLEKVFQYPRRGGSGIIRHASGHRGHFHVRFYCQKADRWCS